MTRALATTPNKALSPAKARARKYAQASRSEKTHYVYVRFFKEFAAWCTANGHCQNTARAAQGRD